MQINKYKRAVNLIMQTLNDLVFTKHKPYRQVLEVLGSCNGTNFDELFLHLKKTIVPEIGTWKLRRILLGLETRGIVVRINNVYHLSDSWILGMGSFLKSYNYLLEDKLLALILRESEEILKAKG